MIDKFEHRVHFANIYKKERRFMDVWSVYYNT